MDLMRKALGLLNGKPKEITGGYTDKEKDAIAKALAKGRKFILNSPTSLRTRHKEQARDARGRYSKKSYIQDNWADEKVKSTAGAEIGDETAKYKPGESRTYGVASSAIQSIDYDPERQVASVQYTSGPKKYDFKVSPEELQEFVNAPSKGRQVQNVWRKNNRMPGY